MDQIKYLAAPAFPQFRFEYHPQARKVYFTRISGSQEFGHVVAEGIPDDRMAQMCVLIWLRGFREGTTPTISRLKREQTDHARTSPGPINCSVRIQYQRPQAEWPPRCERCGEGPCPFFDENGNARRT